MANATTITRVSTIQQVTADVRQETYNTYSDPCAYLQANLADLIRAELGVPTSATLECELVSVATVGTKQIYSWQVKLTWSL